MCEFKRLTENVGYQSFYGDIASLVHRRGLHPVVRYYLCFPFLLFPSVPRTDDRRADHDHSQTPDSAGSIVHDNGLFHI